MHKREKKKGKRERGKGQKGAEDSKTLLTKGRGKCRPNRDILRTNGETTKHWQIGGGGHSHGEGLRDYAWRRSPLGLTVQSLHSMGEADCWCCCCWTCWDWWGTWANEFSTSGLKIYFGRDFWQKKTNKTPQVKPGANFMRSQFADGRLLQGNWARRAGRSQNETSQASQSGELKSSEVSHYA